MPAERKDTWASGKLYEPYVVRWSRSVARDFLQWLEMPVQLDEGRRIPICQPTARVALFAGTGLRDVQARAIDVATTIRDFDDYWTQFLGGQAPAPGYAMSLSKARRGALRDRNRATLPIASDGSIRRAWAVRERDI